MYFGRARRSSRKYLGCACSLGDAQDSQIGGQVGSILSSLSGVPGLGAVASLVGGLFGPSAHYTPGGMLYDTAANLLKTQAVTLANLENQFYAQIGSPTRVPVPIWAMNSSDDPQTGPYIAEILGNPSYASATSPDPLIALQASGVYDATISVQKALIAQVQSAMSGLADGSLVVSGGKVMPASVAAPPPDYNSTVSGASAPAPNSYAGVQAAASASDPTAYGDTTGNTGVAPAAAPASFLSNVPPVVLVGGGMLFLVLLLRR